MQDSARKLEENVYYFGRTVETLLLRFGKVVGPLPDLGVAGPPTWGQGGGTSICEMMFYQVSTFRTRLRKKSYCGGWDREARLAVAVCPGTTQLVGWEPLLGKHLPGEERLPAFGRGSPSMA